MGMKYRMYAKSVLGPKYSVKGWKCQDSSGKEKFKHAQAIAVADGHGSSDCFRSELGSGIAIKVAFEQTKSYCQDEDVCEETDIPIIFSETGIGNFKYAIWSEWRRLVKEDWDERLLAHKTLGEGEVRFESVSKKYKERYTSKNEEDIERYLYAAYGTTLLLAVAIESQLLLLQIGDGTCVVLQRDGEYRIPLPPEEENFLNVTVSLCDENANLKIRHAVLDCDVNSPTAPVAVFLSSDGVDDCYPMFRNEQHLYRLCSVILENILEAGYEATEDEITEHLLPGMTAKGSQDDISLAYFVSEETKLLREAYENIGSKFKPPARAVENEELDGIQEDTAAQGAAEKAEC